MVLTIPKNWKAHYKQECPHCHEKSVTAMPAGWLCPPCSLQLAKGAHTGFDDTDTPEEPVSCPSCHKKNFADGSWTGMKCGWCDAVIHLNPKPSFSIKGPNHPDFKKVQGGITMGKYGILVENEKTGASLQIGPEGNLILNTGLTYGDWYLNKDIQHCKNIWWIKRSDGLLGQVTWSYISEDIRLLASINPKENDGLIDCYFEYPNMSEAKNWVMQRMMETPFQKWEAKPTEQVTQNKYPVKDKNGVDWSGKYTLSEAVTLEKLGYKMVEAAPIYGIAFYVIGGFSSTYKE